MIDIRNAWKIYDVGTTKVYALRGMNFSIKKGEFVAIMGPSGSGKSTAVNMVGCLDIPTKGEIYLEGKNIAHMGESELAQIRGQKIGFVFQQFNLLPTLNAIENVMLPMIFQGKSKEERIKRGTHLLEVVGLGDRIYHKPTELSGGQQQRVAVARALANDPDIILADEPTGNLDTKTGELVIKMLCGLHKKEKKTIIMVTHDSYVAKHAQRVARLRDGKIIRGG
ncbi:ABC transporter ATP-binding protein [Candidatus Woesearchaeota archaeon]|nr:ABC transporter ATP-binding protein [Candidatus Woesearchaeota archaeon]